MDSRAHAATHGEDFAEFRPGRFERAAAVVKQDCHREPASGAGQPIMDNIGGKEYEQVVEMQCLRLCT
jgi:hypothetical protein